MSKPVKLSDSSIKDCKLVINEDNEPSIYINIFIYIEGSKERYKEIVLTEDEVVDMLLKVRTHTLNKY